MKTMLETWKLLWDLHIKLGYRDNINAKAKLGRKRMSKKNDFRFSESYTMNYKRYIALGEKKKKGMEGRNKGAKKEGMKGKK